MNFQDRRKLNDLIGDMTLRDAVFAIIDGIEERAFIAGRDSAPSLPGTADIVERLGAVESALTELNPGWRYGAHRQSCTCSACG